LRIRLPSPPSAYAPGDNRSVINGPSPLIASPQDPYSLLPLGDNVLAIDGSITCYDVERIFLLDRKNKQQTSSEK